MELPPNKRTGSLQGCEEQALALSRAKNIPFASGAVALPGTRAASEIPMTREGARCRNDECAGARQSRRRRLAALPRPGVQAFGGEGPASGGQTVADERMPATYGSPTAATAARSAPCALARVGAGPALR